jgi:hypothetical protein
MQEKSDVVLRTKTMEGCDILVLRPLGRRALTVETYNITSMKDSATYESGMVDRSPATWKSAHCAHSY